ncbi:MAG: hypothetical protein RIB41_10005 [Oceanibaculum nanhaiense]|jgi:hypothetical protein|uniref:hypothetical protein n=1 Tax=Oceanibaculum nanhaiense TaxID=1909734 RepID=UPI0032EF1860
MMLQGQSREAEGRGKFGLYEVIEAYRMPFYLAAAVEAVGYAGRFGVPVRTDCARAIAYLERLRRTRSERMKARRAPARVIRRLPPEVVAAQCTGGNWQGGWQWRAERARVLASLLAGCCPADALPQGEPSGASALEQAAAALGALVSRESLGRGVQ